MLKLIALKIYNGCAQHIRKCLKPNMYYYLCNDFYFTHSGELFYDNSRQSAIDDTFFAINGLQLSEQQANKISINISAIVGKNGDGKSSLVEIIIRLINNLAESAKVYDAPLQHIHGLKAELIYQYDDTIYKIVEDGYDNNTQLIEYATLRDGKLEIKNKSVKGTKKIPFPPLFYTWVSNYSHYAYNVYDFQKEWNVDPSSVSSDKEANEACWLYPIFRKNDGYAVPLALHPYRDCGNFDVNKEAVLAKQRLTALFINSTDAPSSFRNITGYMAIGIKLKPIEYSKLQKRTLENYLMSVRTENSSLNWAFARIQEMSHNIKELKESDLEHWYDQEHQLINDLLDDLLGITPDKEGVEVPYKEYLNQMDAYIRENIPNCFAGKIYNKTPRQNTDIKRYIMSLKTLHKKMWRNPDYQELCSYLDIKNQTQKIGSFADYNIWQLARIYLIYQVATHYNINPLIVCKRFKDLSDIEIAQHYQLYKTISIFETYPAYKERLKKKKFPWESCYEYMPDELDRLCELLEQDKIEKSHRVRKLLQTLYYIDESKAKGDIYFRLHELENDKIPYEYDADDEVVLRLDTLKKHVGTGRILLEQLPPPMYESDIVFKRDDKYVEMSTLSSGEKQMLNIIGAVIYHLHNIDSGKIYKTVNIILEEIELYFHPEYQRQFVNRLIRQIKGEHLPNLKAANILFVTHSPFILSDIPKGNVLFLRDGSPDTSMQENTFGANIHSLLKNGFFLPNLPIGEFAYNKINALFGKLNASAVAMDEVAGIEQEIAIVGEPYLREQLYKLFYSLPQVKYYYDRKTGK